MSFNYQTEINDFQKELDEFPQDLCKMCGRCCKVLDTNMTHEELEKLAAEGNNEAAVFVNFFKRFDTIEDAKKVDPEKIETILQKYANKEDFDINTKDFYYCPHITEENLCSSHETRPECCRRYPVHGWLCVAPGCGFEGWQFEIREKYKKLIRRLKEYLIAMESISDGGNVPGQDITIEELKERINKKIEPWRDYGADFW